MNYIVHFPLRDRQKSEKLNLRSDARRRLPGEASLMYGFFSLSWRIHTHTHVHDKRTGSTLLVHGNFPQSPRCGLFNILVILSGEGDRKNLPPSHPLSRPGKLI